MMLSDSQLDRGIWRCALTCVVLGAVLLAACSDETTGAKVAAAAAERVVRAVPATPVPLKVTLPTTREATVAEINELLKYVVDPSYIIKSRIAIRSPDILEHAETIIGSANIPMVSAASITTLDPSVNQMITRRVEMASGKENVFSRAAGYVSVQCLNWILFFAPAMRYCTVVADRPRLESNLSAFIYKLLGAPIVNGRSLDAEHLRLLFLHALFTLGGEPSATIPLGSMPLPATRAETLGALNGLLAVHIEQDDDGGWRRWRVEIDDDERVVVWRNLGGGSWPGPRAEPGELEGAYMMPLDRVAANVALTEVPSLGLFALSFMCKASPVVDGNLVTCVQWHAGTKLRTSQNSLAVGVSGDRATAKNVQALLYHAMFTLAPKK